MIATGQFSVARVRDGAKGDKGDKGDSGISVVGVSREYTVSTSYSELINPDWTDPYTPEWSTTEPTNIDATHYLWERIKTTLSDGSITYSSAVCQRTISGILSDVDNVKGQITNKVWQSDITSSINSYDGSTVSTIRDRVTTTEQNLTGITTRVSAVESTTGSLGTRMTAAESSISQNADKISLVVDSSSSSSSLVLTDNAISAMTNQFVVKDPTGSSTIISGGRIHVDAIKSTNYIAPTTDETVAQGDIPTEPYSVSGSFLNLSNGNFITPNFVLDNTSGDAYFNGAVNATALHVGSSTSTNHLIYENGTIDLETDWLKFDNSTETVVIGKTNFPQINLDGQSMKLLDSNSDPYFLVADKRVNGLYTFTVEHPFIVTYVEKHEIQVGFKIDNNYPVTVLDENDNEIPYDEIKLNRYIYSESYTFSKDATYRVLYTTSDPVYSFNYLKNNNFVGYNAVSFAASGKAYGRSSFVEGSDTTASGYYSHAEGFYTTASGHYGSHAEGSFATASGRNSHAEGSDTTASGSKSHAEGFYTTASGDFSHAEGYHTTASKSCSHAEGTNTTASGDYSHAEGSRTTASGYKSHAEGSDTTASGYTSHAEGGYTTAFGGYSHAEGYETTASGGYGSHAEGNNTVASYGSSHAEGYYTTASGYTSHAEGGYTVASGIDSHAEGSYTTASGDYSHASGRYTYATKDCQTTIGKYNATTKVYSSVVCSDTLFCDDDLIVDGTTYTHDAGNYAFIIGNGTSEDSRSNALTVDWNGRVVSYNPNLTVGTTPSSTNSNIAFCLADKNGTRMGDVSYYYSNDDKIGVSIAAYRSVSGTNKYNTIRLGIDGSGNNSVSISSPDVWRSALGLSEMLNVDAKTFISKSPSVTIGTTPSSSYYLNGFTFRDKNNTTVGSFQLTYLNNGRAGVTMESQRTVNGTTSYNSLRLLQDTNGDDVVELNASAWRTALQLNHITDMVRVVEFKKTNVSIGANTSLSPVTITATAPTGFSFVSVVGWRIDTEGTTSGANSPSCVVTNYWGSTTLNATVRNFASSQAKVTVNLRVLYRRTTL